MVVQSIFFLIYRLDCIYLNAITFRFIDIVFHSLSMLDALQTKSRIPFIGCLMMTRFMIAFLSSVYGLSPPINSVMRSRI